MRISDWSSDVCSSDLAAIEAVDLLRRIDRTGRRQETGIQREAVAGEARRRIQRMMAEKGTDAVERRIVQPCQRYMRAEFTPVGRQAGAQHGIVDLFLQAAEPRARPHPGPQRMDLAAVTEGADAEQVEIEIGRATVRT